VCCGGPSAARDGRGSSAQGWLERARRSTHAPPPRSKLRSTEHKHLRRINHFHRMTINAPPHWPRVFAIRVLVHVTIAAQRVEHRFDLQSNLRVGFVAVDAETLAGIVGEVVVTGDSVDGAVVEVGERQRQQRPCVDHRLTSLISRGCGHGDEHADECGERGATRGGFHSRLRNAENATAIVNATAPM
jgi:hypothetical protein